MELQIGPKTAFGCSNFPFALNWFHEDKGLMYVYHKDIFKNSGTSLDSF